MGEFESAVSASRVKGGECVVNKWPDAASGANGGNGAHGGPQGTGPISGEFSSAVSHAKMQANVTPAPLGPDGSMGWVRGGTDDQAASTGSQAMAGASATCSGDATRAKSWPDAQGGGLGKS